MEAGVSVMEQGLSRKNTLTKKESFRETLKIQFSNLTLDIRPFAEGGKLVSLMLARLLC